jgi:hypothetical protein
MWFLKRLISLKRRKALFTGKIGKMPQGNLRNWAKCHLPQAPGCKIVNSFERLSIEKNAARVGKSFSEVQLCLQASETMVFCGGLYFLSWQ